MRIQAQVFYTISDCFSSYAWDQGKNYNRLRLFKWHDFLDMNFKVINIFLFNFHAVLHGSILTQHRSKAKVLWLLCCHYFFPSRPFHPRRKHYQWKKKNREEVKERIKNLQLTLCWVEERKPFQRVAGQETMMGWGRGLNARTLLREFAVENGL